MLTLAEAKLHLKLDSGPDPEDSLLEGYITAAAATFRRESKKRWPAVGEPVLTQLVDPEATTPEYRFLSYVDPAVLSPDEQQLASQWMRLVVGHWYEQRTPLLIAVNASDVGMSAKYLMDLIREPTL